MGKARATGARPKAPGAPAGARGGRARPNSNPFEVKVNRQKFQVLGRKTRHDVGLPGVSRARAIQKRTQTLLKEYRERDKSNVFIDKRFGEYNSSLSAEEKMMRRFALEQQRHHEKRNVYNLNEEEELTHYGQSLADIEKLNDIVDSDSDPEERGTLSAELTAAHFGGGELPQKRTSQQPGPEAERPRSRKELIEELIAKSKQEKRERQAQREDALELTEKLDRDWREIQSLLARRAPQAQSRPQEKPQPDAYDRAVRELGFELKAQPSDRMKTEEELAKEEQERLRRLEAERVRRMLGTGEDQDSKGPAHVSADDLNDGFVLDKDDRRLLSYEDGKMNVQEEQSGEASDGGNSEEEEEEEEEEEAEDSGGSDSHSDLECGVESEEESERPEQEPRQPPGGRSAGRGQEARDAARTELPYTFAAPESSEDLKCLLTGKSVEEQLLVVERIQKCHHPSLAVGNKAKLELIYLKIAGMLFPTSDLWHPVVTPALVCLSQLLTKCPVLSLPDAVKGLFVCCVSLDYVSLSQRFIPELVNFLLGILYMATPNQPGPGYTLVPPFRPRGKHSELLVVSDEGDAATWQRRSLSLHWASARHTQTETEANHTRLSCLAVCLALVKRCALMYGALPAFHDITRPLRALLAQHLAGGSHPHELQELCRGALADLEAQERRYQPLVCERSKPVPLKLFTPRLVQVLEFGRKQGSTKEEQERKRLIHKHRREFKGAVREIRKDNQFLARMQLSEIMDRDAERKRRVKQLFNSLAEQEGEWKALKRKKFKK
ncbi:nucleolar protein 14 isoform X2 [Eptesicus fuscus]|uniref:nucleolar protein 14 isoform X2 n=1 Tax=Eptesicus fuscus TaxID=29078 RepID=UPI002403DCBF|nr:nucleolar protein 14 isoform X2 [Eptesicus fuscus]